MTVRPVDIARAARCAIGALDEDDLMIRTAVQDACEDDTVAELITALTGLVVGYRREREDDDTIRADLQRLIFDGEDEAP